MGIGRINLHNGLRAGELRRCYLRRQARRGGVEIGGYESDPGVRACGCCAGRGEPDEYYWGADEATARDLQLWRVWRDVLAVGFRPWLDVRWAFGREPELPSPASSAVATGDDVAVALHAHLQRITSQDG